MFDPYDAMEAQYDGETWPTYNGVSATNFFTVKLAGQSGEYFYEPNIYAAVEPGTEEYNPDKFSISSEKGDMLSTFKFTLIRNAADVNATITDAETGAVYFTKDFGEATGTYYSASAGAWQSTRLSAKLGWAATDAEGNPLPDGTKVNVTVSAIPSYYVKNPDKPLGNGTSYTIPMTVDNTAPKAELLSYTEPVTDVSGNVTEKGTITMALSDNRYVGAVYIVGPDKKTNLEVYRIDQKEAGETTEFTFEYPQSVFYIVVYDCAGNTARYRVNASGEPDTTIAESVELNADSLLMVKGSSEQLEATVGPVTLVDDSVTWFSYDESIATVDENGVVKAVGEGVTAIFAVAKSLGADGKPVYAYCAVKVVELNVDLNATVWDEEGKVHFATFNSGDLTLKNLSDEQGAAFMSAAVADGVLYATTMDSSDGDASLYAVDPNTFESTLVADGLYWNTDMAYGAGTGLLYGTYAYYVLVADTQASGGQKVLNLSSYTNGDYLVGLTHVASGYNANYGTNVDYFYAIDESGVIYVLQTLVMNGSVYYGCGAIAETGITTNGEWKYSSLYYDDETGFMFYSCYDGTDEVKFYAIAELVNNETGDSYFKAYALGEFPSKVWPVSGLYQWDDEAMAEVPERIVNKIESVVVAEDISSVEKIKTSLKKQPKLADKKEAVEDAAEDASENEAQVEEEEQAVETPAEDVSENEAAPEEEAPVEEAPVAEAPVEEPVPDTSANDD